jgi:polysaccharide pyruvyl transferase WcaK-like protein
MDDVQVDVVGTEPAQALLHLMHDPAPRVAAAVRALAHREVHLGGENNVVAAALQRLADDLLALAGGVHISGVDEVDALVQGGVDDPDAVGMIRVADCTKHHRAEAMHADLDPSRAESAVTHRMLLRW